MTPGLTAGIHVSFLRSVICPSSSSEKHEVDCSPDMPGCSVVDTPLLSKGTFSETIVSESSSPCSLLLLVSTGRNVPSTKSNIHPL